MSFLPRTTTYARMHVRQLAELAAALALGCRSAGCMPVRISATAMDAYLAATHERQRRWTRRLRQLRRAAAPAADARACLEEIFVSEALACVWGALVEGVDRLETQDGYCAAVAARVALAHAECRNQAMRLLAGKSALARQEAAELDRLRRSMARWIDLLVAHVQQRCFSLADGRGADSPDDQHDLCRFAVEPQRAREFADDLRDQQASGVGGQSLSMAAVSFRAALSRQLRRPSPNGELNHSVAHSVVACLPPDLFDATGPYRTLWATRLIHRAADAERLVESLL